MFTTERQVDTPSRCLLYRTGRTVSLPAPCFQAGRLAVQFHSARSRVPTDSRSSEPRKATTFRWSRAGNQIPGSVRAEWAWETSEVLRARLPDGGSSMSSGKIRSMAVVPPSVAGLIRCR